MADELSLAEKKVLVALQDGATRSPQEVSEQAGLSTMEVMNASSWLRAKGLLQRDERLLVSYALGAEGREYASTQLPERRLAEALLDKPDGMGIEELPTSPAFAAKPDQHKIAIGQARRKGLVMIERQIQKEISLNPDDAKAVRGFFALGPVERELLKHLVEIGKDRGVPEDSLENLASRRFILENNDGLRSVVNRLRAGGFVEETGGMVRLALADPHSVLSVLLYGDAQQREVLERL
ncbi:MAG: hypothetical protein LC624_08895, partial [Halobacteriales archaeon]|nr:hypothetical protein [Halobacteriales archaeon]